MYCVYWCSIPLTRHRINGVGLGQSVEKEADKKLVLNPIYYLEFLESFLLCKFAFPSKSLHP